MDSSEHVCIAYLINDLNNEYSTNICRGSLHAARELGVSVVVFGVGTLEGQVPNARLRNKLFALINPDDFDGIVYTSASIASVAGIKRFLEVTAQYGDIPSVHIGLETPEYMSFTIDNKAAMYEITNHMIKVHGRKRIAFIYGAKGGQESDARFEGYQQALEENGISYDDRYVYEGLFLRNRGIQAIKEFLDVRRIELDAVVSSCDTMALYAMKELRRRGYRVPEDVSVSGFDDISVARSHEPALTTIRQPLGRLGYVSMKIFVDRLRERAYQPSEHTVNAHLVLRESCGCETGEEVDGGVQTEIDNDYRMSFTEKKELEVNLHEMSRNIIGTFNEEEIRTALNHSLGLFDIEQFSLAKYIDDESSVVFYSLDGNRGQKFVSRRLVHEGLESFPQPFIKFVLPLHFRNESIGFFISDKGSTDMSVLEVMRDHISGALKGAALIKDVRSYAANLEEMVKERTVELENALGKVQAVSEKLERLAVMDELTGLYNRRGFLSVAGKQIERMKRRHQDVLLVFLDVDCLKHINDNFGHGAGDTVIKALAAILVKVFRKTDIIARWGGDEFTVLAIDCSPSEYRAISQRMSDYVEEYNEASGNEFNLSVSHGAAPYKEDSGNSLEELMEEADARLREFKQAKKQKKGNCAGPEEIG
jgi:diguanylate cyclase (GGDEF)-like protein